MKKLLLVLLPLTFFVLQSCNKDFGSVEVSYKKATAVYGDLAAIRNTPLMEGARSITDAGKIFVAENLLLIGEEGDGIHIVDNTDPKNPANLSFMNIPGNREYYVAGNVLYAESHYDLLKIDISNKSQPRIVSRVEDAFATSDNFKNDKGEILIKFNFEDITEKVSEDSEIYQQLWGHQEIYYYDFANQLIPPSQVPVSFAGNSSASVGSVNRIAATKGHVYVINTNAIHPFEDNGDLTAFEKIWSVGGMETIYPDGDKLYIGTQQSMEIFDIRNPAQPQWTASFQHANSCDPVLPCGDVAYVTLRTGDVGNCPGDENALLVLDVKTSNPTQLQEIEMESPFGMTIVGSKLYVGEGSNGLKVFNIEDKQNITLDTWEPNIEAYDIIHHPTNPNLILIAGPVGISQYEIEGDATFSLLSTMAL